MKSIYLLLPLPVVVGIILSQILPDYSVNCVQVSSNIMQACVSTMKGIQPAIVILSGAFSVAMTIIVIISKPSRDFISKKGENQSPQREQS